MAAGRGPRVPAEETFSEVPEKRLSPVPGLRANGLLGSRTLPRRPPCPQERPPLRQLQHRWRVSPSRPQLGAHGRPAASLQARATQPSAFVTQRCTADILFATYSRGPCAPGFCKELDETETSEGGPLKPSVTHQPGALPSLCLSFLIRDPGMTVAPPPQAAVRRRRRF